MLAQPAYGIENHVWDLDRGFRVEHASKFRGREVFTFTTYRLFQVLRK
jgi:hypothetical protein